MKYDNFLVIIKSEHGHKDSETYEELRRVNCGNFLCVCTEQLICSTKLYSVNRIRKIA